MACERPGRGSVDPPLPHMPSVHLSWRSGIPRDCGMWGANVVHTSTLSVARSMSVRTRCMSKSLLMLCDPPPPPLPSRLSPPPLPPSSSPIWCPAPRTHPRSPEECGSPGAPADAVDSLHEEDKKTSKSLNTWQSLMRALSIPLFAEQVRIPSFPRTSSSSSSSSIARDACSVRAALDHSWDAVRCSSYRPPSSGAVTKRDGEETERER